MKINTNKIVDINIVDIISTAICDLNEYSIEFTDCDLYNYIKDNINYIMDKLYPELSESVYNFTDVMLGVKHAVNNDLYIVTIKNDLLPTFNSKYVAFASNMHDRKLNYAIAYKVNKYINGSENEDFANNWYFEIDHYLEYNDLLFLDVIYDYETTNSNAGNTSLGKNNLG